MARRKSASSGSEDAVRNAFDQLVAAHGGDVNAVLHDLGRHLGVGSVNAPRSKVKLRQPPAEPVTLRVRVDIDGAKPPIWRRLDLAGELTLAQVDRALQAVFWWDGLHLHAFRPRVGGAKDRAAPAFANEGLGAELSELAPEDEVRLDEVLGKVGDVLYYEYDFGDSWGHTIKVEAVRPRGEGPLAACLGGRRAAPPEDCGGIYLYNDVAAALAGKDSSVDADELDDFRDWVGDEFDPDDAALEGLDDLDAIVRGGGGSAFFLGAPRVEIVFDWDGSGLPELPKEIVAAAEKVDPVLCGALIGNPRLAVTLDDLVTQAEEADALAIIALLVERAGLDITGTPVGAPRAALFASLPRQEAIAVTAPWRELVEQVGADGIKLDPDGTAVAVEAPTDSLFADLGGDADAVTVTRADLVPTGVTFGLLRKAKGRVFSTKAARDAVADPVRLWRHLADRLGRGVGRDEALACALALLAAAGDAPARKAFASVAEPLFLRLGLRRGDGMPLTPDDILAASDSVWQVLEASGGLGQDGKPTEPGRRLARAALLTY